MHALTMLHRLFSASCPQIHAKRLTSLCAATAAAVCGRALTLSDLGRGLPSRVSMKHNIKRIDRLLGNRALHAETPLLYAALVRHYLVGIPTPLIIIDWSDLTADRHWQLLRASVVLTGRSVTLYEQVHPIWQAATLRVHEAFLAQLAAMLPPDCVPILLTDAGFRGTWFRLVNRMGWYWIGRLRNRDMVKPVDQPTWSGCKSLYAKATECACGLGPYEYVRAHPVACRLVLVKRRCQGRHKRSVHGKPVHSAHSLKKARAQREPWLLAACPALAYLSPDAVVALYAQRMQIEEEFRDLKSGHFGLGFSANRSRHKERLGVLLLIACLAFFVLRLIGETAHACHLERQCQSNTRRSRPVLSIISLARQLTLQGLPSFPRSDFNAALCRLRRYCSILPV